MVVVCVWIGIILNLLIVYGTGSPTILSTSAPYTTTLAPDDLYVEYELTSTSTFYIESYEEYEEMEIENAVMLAMSETTFAPANYMKNYIEITSVYNTTQNTYITNCNLTSKINATDLLIAQQYQYYIQANKMEFDDDVQTLLGSKYFNSTNFKFEIKNLNPIFTTVEGQPIEVTHQLQINFTMNVFSNFEYTYEQIMYSIVSSFQNVSNIIKANYMTVDIINQTNKTENNFIQYNINCLIDATSQDYAKSYERDLNNGMDNIETDMAIMLSASSVSIVDWVTDIVEYSAPSESKTVIWFLVGSGICAVCALVVIISWRHCTKPAKQPPNDSIGLEYLLDPNDQQNMTLNDSQLVGVNDGATKNLWASPIPMDENEIMDDYNKLKNNNPNIENEINTNDIENDIKNIKNTDVNNNQSYDPPNLSKKNDEIILVESINNLIDNKTKIFSRLTENPHTNDNDNNNNPDTTTINDNNKNTDETTININNDGDIDEIIQNAQKTLDNAKIDNIKNDIDVNIDVMTVNIDDNMDINVDDTENILSDEDQGEGTNMKPAQFSRLD